MVVELALEESPIIRLPIKYMEQEKSTTYNTENSCLKETIKSSIEKGLIHR